MHADVLRGRGIEVWESSRVSEERPVVDPPGTATPVEAATAQVPAPAAVHVTRLISEAASKSGLIWVRLPDGDAYPVWHVWHDDGDERGTGPAAYVVSGPGEQVAALAPRRGRARPAQQGHRGSAHRRPGDRPRGHPRGCRVGRRGRGAAARAAQRRRRRRAAVAGVVHDLRADATRPARRGPRRRTARSRAPRGCGPPRRPPAAGGPGTGAVGPEPAATPAPA